jgi:hypothetical protein
MGGKVARWKQRGRSYLTMCLSRKVIFQGCTFLANADEYLMETVKERQDEMSGKVEV